MFFNGILNPGVVGFLASLLAGQPRTGRYTNLRLLENSFSSSRNLQIHYVLLTGRHYALRVLDCWLAGWLAGWLFGCLAGWLAGWLALQVNFFRRLSRYPKLTQKHKTTKPMRPNLQLKCSPLSSFTRVTFLRLIIIHTQAKPSAW